MSGNIFKKIYRSGINHERISGFPLYCDAFPQTKNLNFEDTKMRRKNEFYHLSEQKIRI